MVYLAIKWENLTAITLLHDTIQSTDNDELLRSYYHGLVMERNEEGLPKIRIVARYDKLLNAHIMDICQEWIAEREEHFTDKNPDPRNVAGQFKMYQKMFRKENLDVYFPKTVDIVKKHLKEGFEEIFKFYKEYSEIEVIFAKEDYNSGDSELYYGNHMPETIISVLNENYDTEDKTDPRYNVYSIRVHRKEETEENDTND